MSKERLKGLLYVLLVAILGAFSMYSEGSESYWSGPATYNYQGCDPETVEVIDQVAEELSRYSIPLTYSENADIEIVCSPTNHLEGSPTARGTTTRHFSRSTKELINVEMWINSLREQDNILHTVRHEMAHAVGVGHLPSPQSLMHYAAEGSVDYYDWRTLKVLLDKYKHTFAAVDQDWNRYVPCNLIKGEFYYSTEFNEGETFTIYTYGINENC